jgi:AP-1 complex subunit gamma-1
MLLDLMGGGDDSMPASNSGIANGGSQNNNADLLADILGGGGDSAGLSLGNSSAINTSAPASNNNASSILDLFGSPAPPQQSQQQQSSEPAHPVYSKNGLTIAFSIQRTAQAVQVTARFRNADASSISAVNLQAAVPKTQKLQLQAISSSELAAGQEATQPMRVTGAQAGVSSFVQSRLLFLLLFLYHPSHVEYMLTLCYHPGASTTEAPSAFETRIHCCFGSGCRTTGLVGAELRRFEGEGRFSRPEVGMCL